MTLKFAAAHGMTLLISKLFRTRMFDKLFKTQGNQVILANGVRVLNGKGQFAEFFTSKIAATFGFWTVGKLAHYFDKTQHSSSFIEELIMLVQFELGTAIPTKIGKIFKGSRAKRFKAAHERALKAKAELLSKNPDASKSEQLLVMLVAYKQSREGISARDKTSFENLIRDLQVESSISDMYKEFIEKGVTTTASTNTEANVERREKERKEKERKEQEESEGDSSSEVSSQEKAEAENTRQRESGSEARVELKEERKEQKVKEPEVKERERGDREPSREIASEERLNPERRSEKEPSREYKTAILDYLQEKGNLDPRLSK